MLATSAQSLNGIFAVATNISINKKQGRQYVPSISLLNTMSMLDNQRGGTQYNNKNTTLSINDKEGEIS